jgi:hypothetical protein
VLQNRPTTAHTFEYVSSHQLHKTNNRNIRVLRLFVRYATKDKTTRQSHVTGTQRLIHCRSLIRLLNLICNCTQRNVSGWQRGGLRIRLTTSPPSVIVNISQPLTTLQNSLACYGMSLFFICIRCSYPTGNTPLHLYDLLRGCLYFSMYRMFALQRKCI